MKYLSSIFNFNTLQGGKCQTLSALAVALFCLFTLECTARLFLEDATLGWDYWSYTSASKYETYFQMQKNGESPGILFVGDSSADYGVSANSFNKEIECDECSYNLATLGNFPLSFDLTVNRLILDPPNNQLKYLVIIFTRGAFEKRHSQRESEQSILSSSIIRRLSGEISSGDIFILARLWRARQNILKYFTTGNAISLDRGFHSRTANKKTTIVKPLKKRNLIIDEERLLVLEKTLRLCKEYGIEPILVHPPIHSLEKLRWTNPDAYVENAYDLSKQFKIPFWDYSKVSEYDGLMNDLVHLNEKGATIFSNALATRFKTQFPKITFN